MNNDKETKMEEMQIIDLTPSYDVDTTQQMDETEPVIIIERDDSESVAEPVIQRKPRNKRKIALITVIVFVVLLVGAYVGWHYYMNNYYVGMPVSCSPNENIEKLQTATKASTHPEVVFTHDSVGTVALNMYELRGLRADITYQEPDSADQNVYLYTRCADYGKNGQVLGSMVIDGKKMISDRSRLGYCGMVNNNTVIGIARNDAVCDYAEENGGSFFRQFILVSNGEIPRVFHLHKKVERRALARMDDQLYYIESCNAETMYDFADAIRKYGFIDAIYITGGNCHSYYRTADGAYHNIGLPVAQDKNEKNVWLVFTKQR